jgi:hypothetical protein
MAQTTPQIGKSIHTGGVMTPVQALFTLSFPSVQYVWTTQLTTTINFSKFVLDEWEYSLSKQRIAI